MKKIFFSTIILFASLNVFANGFDFATYDLDQDGLISIEEAKADDTLTSLFAELDLNQDGYLSKLEINVQAD
jgi:hypothetical protein